MADGLVVVHGRVRVVAEPRSRRLGVEHEYVTAWTLDGRRQLGYWIVNGGDLFSAVARGRHGGTTATHGLSFEDWVERAHETL